MLEARGLIVTAPGPMGPIRLIDDVSLTLRAGKILGVVGESGAGKSLTGAALMGLLDPPLRQAGGNVLLHGATLGGGVTLRRGRDVGMIFQDPLTALNPLFSIGHQLVETILVHHAIGATAARERATKLLAEVGIGTPAERLAQYPHELSGGMRQRVVIALALAPDPSVLIADEPTTALDVSVQAQILSLVRNICDARGMAVLFITHDLGVIAQIADDVAVMYAGRVVESGSVEAVLSRPCHPYTRGLLACTLEIGERRTVLAQIGGAAPRAGALPSGCAFHPRCPDRTESCVAAPPPLVTSGGLTLACWNAPHG